MGPTDWTIARSTCSGTASLQAKLSQTTTGIKSFFLKALDPFFEKKNAGAVIPIHIGGTSDVAFVRARQGSARLPANEIIAG